MMNVSKTLLLVGLAVVTVSLPGRAQTEPPAASGDGVGFLLSPAPPATRLENVLALKGAIIQKSFTELGIVGGEEASGVRMLAVQFHNLKARAEFGVVVEVRQSRGTERVAVAYVDEDEIDSLVTALDGLGRLERTAFTDFEGLYRTRGSLEVENQSDNGSRFLALRATEVHALTGRVVWATARFRLSSLPEMARLLSNAKEAIAQAKAPPKAEENK